MVLLSSMRLWVLLLAMLSALLLFIWTRKNGVINYPIVKYSVKEPLVKDEITTATTNVSKNNSGLETPKVVLF